MKERTWKRWTKKDLNLLKENQTSMTIEELAEKLDRTVDSISCKLRRMGNSTYKYRPWTKEEEDILRNYYHYSRIKEISEKLNRTENSIWLKVLRMKREDENLAVEAKNNNGMPEKPKQETPPENETKAPAKKKETPTKPQKRKSREYLPNIGMEVIRITKDSD